MFPNLFEATQEYWRELDELEKAYQQGKIQLDEVDTKVAELMGELAQERRAAVGYFWQSFQHLLITHKETIAGVALVAVVTYGWLLTRFYS
jgi:hypothetical protein